MVKNKALPDSARLCQNLQTPLSGHSLSLSLSFCLPPSKTWTYQGWSHVFSLCLSLTPFMLRVPPGSCWGWTLAIIGKALLACLALIKFVLILQDREMQQVLLNPFERWRVRLRKYWMNCHLLKEWFDLMSPHFWGFPIGSMGKESTCNAGDAGDAGLIPQLRRFLEEGMTTHTSILAWRIHGQRSLVSYSP